MAVIANSNQYALQTTVRRSGEPLGPWARFDGLIATATTGTINCIKLPPGKLNIFPYESRWQSANMVSGANVSVGYAAYTDANGAAVAANTVALLAATAAGAGAVNAALTTPTTGCLKLDSLDGVTITATVTDANTVANQTFSGYVAFAKV